MVFAATEFPLPMRKGKRRCSSGVRGETYAYWHLRRLGYIFIARNYAPSRAKGEIDLIGFDGDALVFVEVRTRSTEEGRQRCPN